MSVYQDTYLGPYLVIKTSKIVQLEKYRSCSNSKCDKHKLFQHYNFCSECGSPILEQSFSTEVDSVDAFKVQQELNETVCLVPGDEFYTWMNNNNTHIWISNRGIPGLRPLFLEGMFGPAAINNQLIYEETAVFVNFFEKEIQVLEKAYGKTPVIRWGLLRF